MSLTLLDIVEWLQKPASWPLAAGVLCFVAGVAAWSAASLKSRRSAETQGLLRVFSNVLEFSPDGFFLWRTDADGTDATLCSRRASVMLGLPLGSSSTFAQLMDRLDADGARALKSAVGSMRSGTSVAFSLEIKVHGRSTPLLVHGNHITDLRNARIADVLWFKEPMLPTKETAKIKGGMTTMATEIAGLRQTLDALPLAIWVHDRSLNAVYSNAAFKAFQLPELEIRALAAKARAARSERTEVIRAASRPLVCTERPFQTDENGAPSSTIGWARPLSEIELSAETVLDRWRTLRAAFDAVETATLLLKPDLTVIGFNAEFLNLWGIDAEKIPENLPYGSLLDLLKQQDRLPATRDFQAFKNDDSADIAMAEEREPRNVLFTLGDGRSIHRTSVKLPDGFGYLLTYDDVTQEYEREMRIKSSDMALHAALDAMADGAALFGADGRLILCNRAFQRLWDIDDDTIAARPLLSEVIALKQPFFPGGSAWNRTRELMLGLLTDAATREIVLTRKDRKKLLTTTVNTNGGVLIIYHET